MKERIRQFNYHNIASRPGRRHFERKINQKKLVICVVHPFYGEAREDLKYILSIKEKDRSKSQVEYLGGFKKYKTYLKSLVYAADRCAIPILILQDRQGCVENFSTNLEATNLTNNIFYIETHDGYPIPRGYAKNMGGYKQFTSSLKATGLKKVVIAGAYFGGNDNCGNVYDYTVLTNAQIKQSALNTIQARGCAGGSVEAFSAVGIDTFVSQATFPQRLTHPKNLVTKPHHAGRILDPTSKIPKGLKIRD